MGGSAEEGIRMSNMDLLTVLLNILRAEVLTCTLNAQILESRCSESSSRNFAD